MIIRKMVWICFAAMLVAGCSDSEDTESNDDVDAATEESALGAQNPDDDDDDEADEDDEDDDDKDSDDDAKDDDDKDSDDDAKDDDKDDSSDEDDGDEDDAGDEDAQSDEAAADTDADDTDADDDTDEEPTAPELTGQLGACETSETCAEGLTCYTLAGYCSAQCASDDDCVDLGLGYTCALPLVPPQGQGMMDEDSASEPTGACRLSCGNGSAETCPDGMECQRTPFGGNAICGYAEPEPVPASIEPFGYCSDEIECTEGYSCLPSFFGLEGHCAQRCESDEDCTTLPETGDAPVLCGPRGYCSPYCAREAEDGTELEPATCPTDMNCTSTGWCNYGSLEGPTGFSAGPGQNP